MSNQQAVEWLIDEMNNIKGSSISMNGRVQFIEKELNKLFEQAKAMEKEQKIEFAFDFYYDFSNQLGVPFNLISENRLNAEQYYNETFIR